MSLADLQALWFEASLLRRTPSGDRDKTEELLITHSNKSHLVAGIHKAVNHFLLCDHFSFSDSEMLS